MLITVTAREDIKFKRGMTLAKVGDIGTALVGVKPNRPHHYGLVPVLWRGLKRAYWVEKEKLQSTSELEECITPPPEKELDLTIPKSRTESFSFGHNLRLFRKARSMSQGELAHRMLSVSSERFSQTSISNWENRTDCPSGTFLAAAAEVLDVPAFAFFVPLNCVKVEDCMDYIRGLRKHVCGAEEQKNAETV